MRRTVSRDTLVSRVMIGIKDRLLAPDLVETFIREFTAEINAANQDRARRAAGLGNQLAKTQRQIRALIEMAKDGLGTASLVEELRGLEAKQTQLKAEITATETPEPVPALHPNIAAIYRAKVEMLEEGLRSPATYAIAAEALRSLVESIVITPGAARGEVFVTLRGDLAAFIRLADGEVAPAWARAVGWTGSMGNVGCGDRI